MSEQIESTAVATSIAQLPAPTTVLDILGDRARALLQYAQARVVQSDEDVKSAINDLSIISRAKKALEDRRQEYVMPLHEETKHINEAFKGVSDPLSEADKLTRAIGKELQDRFQWKCKACADLLLPMEWEAKYAVVCTNAHCRLYAVPQGGFKLVEGDYKRFERAT